MSFLASWPGAECLKRSQIKSLEELDPDARWCVFVYVLHIYIYSMYVHIDIISYLYIIYTLTLIYYIPFYGPNHSTKLWSFGPKKETPRTQKTAVSCKWGARSHTKICSRVQLGRHVGWANHEDQLKNISWKTIKSTTIDLYIYMSLYVYWINIIFSINQL